MPDPMTYEPSVTVPVSLIEELGAADDANEGERFYAALHRLRALLSQRPPTAEPTWPKQTTQPGVSEEEVMRRVDRSVGKLPSITDMVPGTRFGGQQFGDPAFRRWFLHHEGSVVSDDGTQAHINSIDPSTIRDVTVPKEKP